MDPTVFRRVKVAAHYLLSYSGIVRFQLNLYRMIDFKHILVTGTDAWYILLTHLFFASNRKYDHSRFLLAFY